MSEDIKIQLVAIIKLLTEKHISNGEIITAAAKIIWEEKYDVDLNKVEEAFQILNMFKSKILPKVAVMAGIITEMKN
jgi:hypothetical protein